MFRAVLCGAGDTSLISDDFKKLVTAIGGDPWHYQSGTISYLNHPHADFRRNSARTVAEADVLVFVILERFGEISWDTELREAVGRGKAILILCLQTTYQTFLEDRGRSSALDPRLFRLLQELEVNHSMTIVPFTQNTFLDVLRRQLSQLFRLSLLTLEERHRRGAMTSILRNPESASPHDLELMRLIALDELEEKRLRKEAILGLASRDGVDDETLLELAGSLEQGVSRLAFAQLPRLIKTRPVSLSLLEELTELAGDSDDAGLPRRLVASLFSIDPEIAVTVLVGIPSLEVGTRRRIAQLLFEHQHTIRSVMPESIKLLRRCFTGDGERNWLKRAKALLTDWEGDAAAPTATS